MRLPARQRRHVLLGLMWVVYRTAMPILIERMSA
jgi:hypothetical protein